MQTATEMLIRDRRDIIPMDENGTYLRLAVVVLTTTFDFIVTGVALAPDNVSSSVDYPALTEKAYRDALAKLENYERYAKLRVLTEAVEDNPRNDVSMEGFIHSKLAIHRDGIAVCLTAYPSIIGIGPTIKDARDDLFKKTVEFLQFSIDMGQPVTLSYGTRENHPDNASTWWWIKVPNSLAQTLYRENPTAQRYLLIDRAFRGQ